MDTNLYHLDCFSTLQIKIPRSILEVNPGIVQELIERAHMQIPPECYETGTNKEFYLELFEDSLIACYNDYFGKKREPSKIDDTKMKSKGKGALIDFERKLADILHSKTKEGQEITMHIFKQEAKKLKSDKSFEINDEWVKAFVLRNKIKIAPSKKSYGGKKM